MLQESGRSIHYHKAYLLVVGVLAFVAIAFSIISCARASNLRERFVPLDDYREQDFTPRHAPSIDDLPRNASVEMMSGATASAARLVEWKPQSRTIETKAEAPDTLHVPSFMFPGWTCWIDGMLTSLRAHPDLKTILIDVPPGNHVVKLVFANTVTRKRAEWISAAAVLLCVVLIISSGARATHKKWNPNRFHAKTQRAAKTL